MTGEVEVTEAPPPRRRRRWLKVLAGVLLLLALAIGIAWFQRIQLAEGFIARELAKRGVSARYVVKEIGFFRQRIENVSLGDPNDPDLTADWVEVDTGLSSSGPVVTGVRAGQVRLRGVLRDGRLSLGEVDKLMGPPSGKPFALPKLHVEVGDARMALATPYGPMALKLSGGGLLNDGFAGQLLASAPRFSGGGCTARQLTADVAIRIEDSAPILRGPVRGRALACGETLVWEPEVTLDARLDATLSKWRGEAEVALGSLALGEIVAEPVEGTIGFEGSAARTTGQVELTAGRLATEQLVATRLSLSGRYEAGTKASWFDGRVRSPSAALDPELRRSIAGLGRSGAGTPAGPLLVQFAKAAELAARVGQVEADVRIDLAGDAGSLKVTRGSYASASGARIALDRGGMVYGFPGGTLLVAGSLTTRGGGLPEMAVRLSQTAPGGPIQGVAFVQPYAAGGARLDLSTLRFVADAGGITRISTQAVLSGPLTGGRIDGLAVPLEARWDGRNLAVNTGCAPVAFRRLAVSSLVLDPTRAELCPVGGAMVTLRDGQVGGGVGFNALRLGGRIGSAPLAVDSGSGSFRLADQSFVLGAVDARIGETSVTHIAAARLTGTISGGAVAGEFGGAGGRIGNVPLVLSDAAGGWRFDRAALALEGSMRISDAAEAPRFHPLVSNDVLFNLVGNRINAAGTLRAPESGTEVAHVVLSHDLNSAEGRAALSVERLTFADNGLQPDTLTPLTFGVIAAVNGTISGQGRIRWNGSEVASEGEFRTDGMDLAAAFGPVTGIRGEIRFEDLLGMRTPPGQAATVATINPGVPVENGTVRYRLLDSTHVEVEGARWPFAGGVLELEPTVLDFSKDQERRMTFRLTGVDAAQFLQQFNFANLNATGTFDGVLPMVFDARGGRIEGGRLKARAGGSIAYIGELSQRDLGYWGNLAFQSLKALNYRSLEMEMNGSLAGDMVTQIRFAGVSQGEGAKRNFLTRRIERLPLVFNVTVRAPFRQLLESIQSYYDPSKLVERNLPALLEEEERRRREQDIQPSESETVP